MSAETRWYVVQTYVSYENNVKTSIEKKVENLNMQDQILAVKIPTVIETDVDTGKEYERKLFPGYVFVNMTVSLDDDGRPVMSDEAWVLVRQTRGVSSILGSGKPIPMSEAEVKKFKLADEIEVGNEENVDRETASHDENEEPSGGIGIRRGSIEKKIKVSYEVGDTVIIKTGSFANTEGIVQEINLDKKFVKIVCKIFGRDSTVEVNGLDSVELAK